MLTDLGRHRGEANRINTAGCHDKLMQHCGFGINRGDEIILVIYYGCSIAGQPHEKCCLTGSAGEWCHRAATVSILRGSVALHIRLRPAAAIAEQPNPQPGGLVEKSVGNRGVHRDADGHGILVEDHSVGVARRNMIVILAPLRHDAEEHHAAGHPLQHVGEILGPQ